MIKWIRKKLGERKLKRLDDAYTHGYDYAAGALMRGEKTPYDLEAEADTSSAFNEDLESREWDRGIIAAIDKLVLHGVVIDNRYCADWPEYRYAQDYEEEGTLHDLGASVRRVPSLRLVQTGVKENENVPT